MSTVTAISTPTGRGAIGLVRVTGEDAIEISDRVFKAISGKPLASLKGYTAAYGEVVFDGEIIDEGVATVFRSPKSYTGEDMVEISCHGNPLIATNVLKALIDAGAEPAGAGEFTKRAFLNGKMDLTEAEGVAELIAAKGEAAIRLARRKRSGALSDKIDSLSEGLTYLAAQLAVWLDYPDDVVMEMTHQEMLPIVIEAKTQLSNLVNQYRITQKITKGIACAIVGRPNAGKSTLMNLLSGEDKSIVTHYAGTTRDVVENTIDLGNITLKLLDTAGLRETDDPVEAIGVKRAYQELEKADIAIMVIDSSSGINDEDRRLLADIKDRASIIILNKKDLGAMPQLVEQISEVIPKATVWDSCNTEVKIGMTPIIYLNGKNGEGMGALREALAAVCGITDGDDLLIVNQREQGLLQNAESKAGELIDLIESYMPYDIITVAVDEVLKPLWQITGRSAGDEVIKSIFEKFCVGK